MHGEAHEPADEFRYALAGPLVTAAIGGCFGIAAALLSASPAGGGGTHRLPTGRNAT